MLKQHLEVGEVGTQDLLDALKLRVVKIIIEALQLCEQEVVPKIDLLLLYIVVDGGALVHYVHRHHQLNVRLHFRDYTLLPRVLVQVH